MPRPLRVAASRLNDRIDAVYYRPEFIQNEERLLRSNIPKMRLRDLVSNGRRAVYFETTTLEREQAPPDWVPFLTSDDIDDSGCFIDLDARRRVPPSFADRYRSGLLRANELLVKVKGPSQTTAYNEPEPPRRILVSGTIWGSLVRRELVDPHYLVATLSSSYAALARSRLRTNLNVEFLSPDDLQGILLPIPANEASQAYIGNKVRQAERLRYRARAIEAQFREVLAGRYPAAFGPVLETGRTSRASAAELDADLNPGQFNPERVRVRRYITGGGGTTLGAVASITTPVTASYSSSDGYLGLDGISSDSCMLTPGSISENRVEGAVRVLPEGPAIARLRPYLNKVCYVPAELAGCFGSTELLCVRPSSGVSGRYLYGVLKLEATVRQLNPVSTGSTHPRVSREDVLGVVIPWHEDQESLGERLARAQRMYFAAHRLIAAGSILVEALIDGRVDEAELIAAREDPAADRALLRRLTPEGLDIGQAPLLFPDLDALFHEIAESADGFTAAV